MKDRKYHTVRKTNYDKLWHAVFNIYPEGYARQRESWDRVTEKEALKIAKTL
jgi:hypothetical protein